MEVERTVRQKPYCGCDYWCDGGQPTPYPLGGLPDIPSDNKIDNTCEGCRFLLWDTVEIIISKEE